MIGFTEFQQHYFYVSQANTVAHSFDTGNPRSAFKGCPPPPTASRVEIAAKVLGRPVHPKTPFLACTPALAGPRVRAGSVVAQDTVLPLTHATRPCTRCRAAPLAPLPEAPPARFPSHVPLLRIPMALLSSHVSLFIRLSTAQRRPHLSSYSHTAGAPCSFLAHGEVSARASVPVSSGTTQCRAALPNLFPRSSQKRDRPFHLPSPRVCASTLP